MPCSARTLKDLLLESSESDDPVTTLYRFVRKTAPCFDITGCEEEAISLLINFSVKREDITDPLDKAEAIEHLVADQNKLIKRFTNTLRGLHTHNTKFPRSYVKGNIYHRYQYDETDPYVHPGSVKPSKQLGYSQNAAYIKASKGLIAEFVFEGRQTCMFEEIRKGSQLSDSFLNVLFEATELAKEQESENKGTHREKKQETNPVETLIDTVNSFPDEVIPDFATDPQIFSLSKPDAPETLLSPVPHTGLMNEIHLRLGGRKWWQKAFMHIGTGNDLHTYGDLLSDSGGELRILRSSPPKVRKGEFRRLIYQLEQSGHLYNFRAFRVSLLEIGMNYTAEETGQVKRWTTYRQNNVLKEEFSKFSRNIFRFYRLLSMYQSIGLNIPEWCREQIHKNKAQQLLVEGMSISTRNINIILDDLHPKLKPYLQAQAAEHGLPLTDHHHQLIRDAITCYLKQKDSLLMP